jgi:hypothetical protein
MHSSWRAFAAVLAVGTLLGALPMRIVRHECSRCPRSCPMHQPDSGQKGKLGCHGAPRGGASRGHGSDHGRGLLSAAGGVGVSGFSVVVQRPPCTDEAAIAAGAVPPMILPATVPAAARLGAAKFADASLVPRLCPRDPPEPRPPALRA